MMKMFARFLILASLCFFTAQNDMLAQSPGGVNTNLRLWLKSNTGVTQSGGKASAWADQSGDGSNAAQSTSAKQPGYTASSTLFNGNPSLDFDLVDDGMPTTANIVSRPYSFFAVYNSASTSGVGRRAVQGSNNWLIGPYSNYANFFAGNWVGQNINLMGSTPVITSATSSSAAGGTLSYHSTMADANNDTGALASSIVSPTGATNYYVRSELTTPGGQICFTVRKVTVTRLAYRCGTITVSGPN